MDYPRIRLVQLMTAEHKDVKLLAHEIYDILKEEDMRECFNCHRLTRNDYCTGCNKVIIEHNTIRMDNLA